MSNPQVQPTREFFDASIASLENELLRAEAGAKAAASLVSEYRGALNYARKQREMFFPPAAEQQPTATVNN